MLVSPDLDGKTYEELIEENISRIPIYSKEWTNYNPSDPGVTVLENLTAFQALQRSVIGKITDKMRLNMLKLAGFTPGEGRAARVYVRGQAAAAETVLLKGQKLYAGSQCFETVKETDTGQGNIKGILLEHDGEFTDVTRRLCDRELPAGIRIFTERPGRDTCFYMVVDRLPAHGKKFAFYINIREDYPCNPPEYGRGYSVLLHFFLLTADGFREIKGKDATGGFLADGIIELQMPAAVPLRQTFHGYEGCVIKCAPEGEYNVSPRLQGIYGRLFPVVQQDTKCLRLVYAGSDSIRIRNAFAGHAHIFVFCREKGRKEYHAYEPYATGGEQRRRYRLEWEQAGEGRIIFDRASGFGPAYGEKDAVTVVLCGEELMNRRKLDKVYGYDGQEMALNPYQNILPSSFCVMAHVSRPGTEDRYAFFGPGVTEPGALRYCLSPEVPSIRIEDPGDYEEAELFIAGLAVHQGAAGNLRPDNEFLADCGGRAAFYNPGPGAGGRNPESIDECSARFSDSVYRPRSLVTQEDYERAVREIPGLGIHKVKAFRRGDGGIGVAVKPYGDEERPVLTQGSLEVIRREVERRRLVTVRTQILQPVYVPIHVHGSIGVKGYLSGGREQIEALLTEMLDYVKTDRNFGETVSFHEIYRALEHLECVLEVCALSMTPADGQLAEKDGQDIRLRENCLCYAGNIDLELIIKS